MFKKYQHVERLGTSGVNGITEGRCYIFPKIDGTNASIWFEDGYLHFGSRNRELSLDKDNAGFMAAMIEDKRFLSFFQKNKNLRLYGEWLVPHSLKTYRDNTWRTFYVFDVVDDNYDDTCYLEYEKYTTMLEEYKIDYIPCIGIANNPSSDFLGEFTKKNQYLIEDDCGTGEGIVIKNYNYKNRYGRQTWAKIVTNEFKDRNKKTFAPQLFKEKVTVEDEIISEWMTESFIEKEFSKLQPWTSNRISEFLGRTYDEFLREESYNFIKKHKGIINFKKLQQLSIAKIKKIKKDIF